MNLNSAELLEPGQSVQYIDGRIAIVRRQDVDNKQVWLDFGNSIGIQQWIDMSGFEMLEKGPK